MDGRVEFGRVHGDAEPGPEVVAEVSRAAEQVHDQGCFFPLGGGGVHLGEGVGHRDGVVVDTALDRGTSQQSDAHLAHRGGGDPVQGESFGAAVDEPSGLAQLVAGQDGGAQVTQELLAEGEVRGVAGGYGAGHAGSAPKEKGISRA
ncbi:hypothetical protein [Streptomyces sp. NPDC053079]|uniref:hypothetical protein n=1 Tax=Streptomyces sp. NPDC053079 TaxID=3365697 RepID=UPI0037CF8C8D